MKRNTGKLFSAFLIVFVMFMYAMPFAAYATGEAPVAAQTETVETAETEEAAVETAAEEEAAPEEAVSEEEEEEAPGKWYATWVALLPPVIAIALALITKGFTAHCSSVL